MIGSLNNWLNDLNDLLNDLNDWSFKWLKWFKWFQWLTDWITDWLMIDWLIIDCYLIVPEWCWGMKNSFLCEVKHFTKSDQTSRKITKKDWALFKNS